MKSIILIPLLTISFLAHAETENLEDALRLNLTNDAQEQLEKNLVKEGIKKEDLSSIEIEADSSTKTIVVKGDKKKHTIKQLAYVGAQLALFLPYGVTGTWAFERDGKPWLDADINIEPSNMLQMYTVGGAYHPFANSFFTGGRVGLLQLTPPFSRGFDPVFDNQPIVEPELGIRKQLFNKNVMFSTAVSAMWIPSTNFEMPVVYRLKLGVSFKVFNSK